MQINGEWLLCDDGIERPIIRGEILSSTEYESLDMSVLGRDILDHFAVIVDRSNEGVCLLRERHSYNIVK